MGEPGSPPYIKKVCSGFCSGEFSLKDRWARPHGPTSRLTAAASKEARVKQNMVKTGTTASLETISGKRPFVQVVGQSLSDRVLGCERPSRFRVPLRSGNAHHALKTGKFEPTFAFPARSTLQEWPTLCRTATQQGCLIIEARRQPPGCVFRRTSLSQTDISKDRTRQELCDLLA